MWGPRPHLGWGPRTFCWFVTLMNYKKNPRISKTPQMPNGPTYLHISYIYKSPTKQCFFKGVFNIRGMGLVISTRNHQIQLGFCAKLAILKTEACKNHFGRSSSLNASVPNDGAKRPSFRGWEIVSLDLG